MIFEREEWNDEAAAKILPLVYGRIKNIFMQEVKSGHFALWRVHDGHFETWLVTSMEHQDGGDVELVVECIAGEQSRGIMQKLKQRAKSVGVTSIRFESLHAENLVQRMAGPLGFERVSSVFRVEI